MTEVDILNSLNVIGDDKAPGVDGFNVTFFKNTWQIIKHEVSEAILEFFHTSPMYRPINCTTITLVPKNPQPC